MKTKQVIVMRTDLKMGPGKMCAQAAHASLGAVFLLQNPDILFPAEVYKAAEDWIHGIFTKICLGINSEAGLLEIADSAVMAGLPMKLITDNGLTVFNGVPTRTCLAIGPAYSDAIDKITGGLKLL